MVGAPRIMSTTPVGSSVYTTCTTMTFCSPLLRLGVPSAFPHSTLRYSTPTLLYATLLYSTLLYSTLLYATLRYATLRYATLRYASQVGGVFHFTITGGPAGAKAEWTV